MVLIQSVTVAEVIVPVLEIPFSISVKLAVLEQPAGVITSTLTSVPSIIVKE